MTTTVRYLLAGGVALVGAIILLILWHLQSGSSLRRIRRDLGDLNPRIRRSAVLALRERDLAPVADRLVALTKTERDQSVLEAVAEVAARTAWQPADSPSIVDLRTWAGVTAGHGAGTPVQPADTAPSVPIVPVHPTPAAVTATDFGIRRQPHDDSPPDTASRAAALIDSVMGQVAADAAARVEGEQSPPDVEDPWAILSEPIATSPQVVEPEASIESSALPVADSVEEPAMPSGAPTAFVARQGAESNQIVLLVHTGKKSKKKQKKDAKKGSKKKG